jgi:DNA-binding NarL/FixJ family response regulator
MFRLRARPCKNAIFVRSTALNTDAVIGSDSPQRKRDERKPILLDSDVLPEASSLNGAEYRAIRRNDRKCVALLLADQRMPHMDGVEFLREAMEIFPGAKRALLTAYADTNAAISAINDASIQLFLLETVGSSLGASLPAIG